MDKLGIGDTAKEIGVSRHTIRNWLEVFSEYLSPSATRTTGKRFADQDINTLKQIRAFRDDGYLLDDIKDLLNSQPEIIEPEEEPEEPEELEQEQEQFNIAPLEFFTNVIEQMQSQHEREISAKDETIKMLQDELRRERLPFWKKWFDL